MHLNTRDTIMKKLLDAQENVRDYETFSKQIDDVEVAGVFKNFAEESGYQAQKLKELMEKYNNQ
jgi:rubrerythrin